MVTTIGRHTVEIYDSIDELPVVRFHRYQKMLLVDAGVGSDIAAFDQRMEKARRFLMAGKTEQAQKELENLRQCVYMIQNDINPKHRAFSALVTKVDGEDIPCTDEGMARVVQLFSDTPIGELTASSDAVKKKIDSELLIYFPALFNDSSVKEYYDIVKKRAIEILKNIAGGVADALSTDTVERLTTALMTYANPQTFTGSDSVEIQFDRQFENLCLALSEQLHVKPKGQTVLEFYNAFDFLQERAKKAANKAAVRR